MEVNGEFVGDDTRPVYRVEEQEDAVVPVHPLTVPEPPRVVVNVPVMAMHTAAPQGPDLGARQAVEQLHVQQQQLEHHTAAGQEAMWHAVQQMEARIAELSRTVQEVRQVVATVQEGLQHHETRAVELQTLVTTHINRSHQTEDRLCAVESRCQQMAQQLEKMPFPAWAQVNQWTERCKEQWIVPLQQQVQRDVAGLLEGQGRLTEDLTTTRQQLILVQAAMEETGRRLEAVEAEGSEPSAPSAASRPTPLPPPPLSFESLGQFPEVPSGGNVPPADSVASVQPGKEEVPVLPAESVDAGHREEGYAATHRFWEDRVRKEPVKTTIMEMKLPVPGTSLGTGLPAVERRIGELRLEGPPRFNGTRKPGVRTWLVEIERWMRLMRYDEVDYVDIVGTRLEGPASSWLNGEQQRIARGARPNFRDWTSFKAELVAAFEPTTEEEAARAQIMSLKQTGRVAGYLQKFRDLKYKIPGMTDAEAYALFVNGLQPAVRGQIGALTKGDLNVAMELAERLDLYQSPPTSGGGQPKKTDGEGSTQKGWQKRGKGKGQGKKGEVNQVEASGSTGTVAAVQDGGQKPKQKKKGHASGKTTKCFACGGPHYVVNCPLWAEFKKGKKSGN